jgi:hypothetical protein
MELPTPSNLFFSLFFGAFGTAYFIYGKKQSAYFLISGIGLLSYTFFVDDTAAIIWTGVALIIAPFILNKFFG